MNRNSSQENQDMNNNWMASSFPDESPPAYSDLFPSGFNVGDGNAGWEREPENIEESSLTTAREPISVPRTENATQGDTELASQTRPNSFPPDSKKKTLANVLGLLDIIAGIAGIIVGMKIEHWDILRLPSAWSILIGIRQRHPGPHQNREGKSHLALRADLSWTFGRAFFCRFAWRSVLYT